MHPEDKLKEIQVIIQDYNDILSFHGDISKMTMMELLDNIKRILEEE